MFLYEFRRKVILFVKNDITIVYMLRANKITGSFTSQNQLIISRKILIKCGNFHNFTILGCNKKNCIKLPLKGTVALDVFSPFCPICDDIL
jgi:hypothetical protein